jgi:hypothetical protein
MCDIAAIHQRMVTSPEYTNPMILSLRCACDDMYVLKKNALLGNMRTEPSISQSSRATVVSRA